MTSTNSVFNNLTIIDRLNITLSNLNMTHLIGKIKIYAGTTLPAGYVWCDGNNGTPNLLSNQYIISDQSDGMQQQTGNNYFTNNMISHTHNVNLKQVKTTECTANIFSENQPGLATVSNFADYINTLNPGNLKVQAMGGIGGPNASGGISVKKSSSKISGACTSGSHGHNFYNQSVTGSVEADFAFELKTDVKNNVKNVTTGETGNDAKYEPPYISIGFIMKNPSTWL